MKELLAEMELQAKLLNRESKSKSKRTESIVEQNIGNKATLTVSLKQEKDKIRILNKYMGNDLKNFRPAYLKIQKDMERLSRLVKPSYLSIYEQMGRALEPIRQHHLEFSRSIELSGLASSHLTEIVQANQRWQDLIDQAAASSRVFEDLTRTHQTWLDGIKPMQDSIAQVQAAAQMSLGDIAYRMTLSERLFAGIDFEALKRSVALPDPVFLKFQEAMCGITSTYEKLAGSIHTFPDLTHLPAYALSGATREIFTTSYALDEVYISDEPERERDVSEIQLIAEVEQETSICIRLLEEVDPALARPYIGAHDALRSRSADRARHVLSSLRELWNHLLRRLAPDEHVIAWVPGEGKELLHDGRPTRRARVLYVCRSLNNEPLSDFVVQDTRALVKLVEVFNHVHELESELTDEQLRALLLRTDSWLTYILQIWEGTR